MKFVTYKVSNNQDFGVYEQKSNKIFSLNALIGSNFKNLLEFIDSSLENKIGLINEALKNRNLVEGLGIDFSDVTLCSPIPMPRGDVLCLGLNYKDHLEETSRVLGTSSELPKYPIYFSKRATFTAGPFEDIPSHSNITTKLDYENELAIIIGKKGKDISQDKVEDYIFGYTILNDFSARDLQKNNGQWFRGKSLDYLTALGPWIVSKDEIPFPVHLDIITRVNNEIRQTSNTKEFIFDIPTVVSDLSKGMTLMPGDIIATGTPSGVGMGLNPRVWLKDGDKVECEIKGIGTLTNTIKD